MHRWISRFLVAGFAAALGAGGMYLWMEDQSRSHDWRWVQEVPSPLDRLRVKRAGWRRLTPANLAEDSQNTWGWKVQLRNPTDKPWRGMLGFESTLTDQAGLVLTRSDTGQTTHTIPAGGSFSVSKLGHAAPRLLDQAATMKLEVVASILCPERVGYDSLVTLLGRDSAQSRRQSREGDVPSFSEHLAGGPDVYCYGGRHDRVNLKAHH